MPQRNRGLPNSACLWVGSDVETAVDSCQVNSTLLISGKDEMKVIKRSNRERGRGRGPGRDLWPTIRSIENVVRMGCPAHHQSNGPPYPGTGLRAAREPKSNETGQNKDHRKVEKMDQRLSWVVLSLLLGGIGLARPAMRAASLGQSLLNHFSQLGVEVTSMWKKVQESARLSSVSRCRRISPGCKKFYLICLGPCLGPLPPPIIEPASSRSPSRPIPSHPHNVHPFVTQSWEPRPLTSLEGTTVWRHGKYIILD